MVEGLVRIPIGAAAAHRAKAPVRMVGKSIAEDGEYLGFPFTVRTKGLLRDVFR